MRTPTRGPALLGSVWVDCATGGSVWVWVSPVAGGSVCPGRERYAEKAAPAWAAWCAEGGRGKTASCTARWRRWQIAASFEWKPEWPLKPTPSRRAGLSGANAPPAGDRWPAMPPRLPFRVSAAASAACSRAFFTSSKTPLATPAWSSSKAASISGSAPGFRVPHLGQKGPSAWKRLPHTHTSCGGARISARVLPASGLMYPT
mmetsp:Transcript_91928/g.260217  ORF Transcript_91928/g.260217 Transcript_91928/m.260217 type:complete len:203 (-) Transcript_91928:101-709(-)